MGQEIKAARFGPEDFTEFQHRLRQETSLLASWFRDGVFGPVPTTAGFELEAWLVDSSARPAGINEAFLHRLASPLVVPELAVFNVELNSTPQILTGNALDLMDRELNATWNACRATAAEFDARMVMIGTLPTADPDQFNLEQMSPRRRFHALNEQLLALRAGEPLKLDIQGRDRLRLEHRDVMLEAATTSFQLHIQVAAEHSARLYNASKLLAAPLVAVAANSPYLFGRDLWDETRIPLFEQAVDVGATEYSKRVTFGVRHLESSVLENFQSNLDHYPVVLPQLMDEPPEQLAHLRLHNGTIWRWVRPLIGFDAAGRPGLRIEQRVIPAGPSRADALANAALFLGAVQALVEAPQAPEAHIPFATARENFYSAARFGLDAELVWSDGRRGNAVELLERAILPLARQGLASLGIAPAEISRWLGIIEGRLRGRQTGARWQRAFVHRHGPNRQALMEAYLERQETGDPVHLWKL